MTMTNVLDFQYDSVLQLLGGGRNEEKVAGVILATQYLADPNVHDVVRKLSTIVSTVSPSFIVRMLQTVTIVDDANLVQPAGISILNIVCKHKKILIMFRDELPLLIYTMFACSTNEEVKNQVVSTIKGLISIVNDEYIISTMKHLLHEYGGFVTTVNPMEVLELFVFMLESIKRESSKLFLSSSNGVLLRSLFVQVFHGAAPELVRDKALSLCQSVLSKSQILDPSWTVVSAQSSSEAQEAPLFPEGFPDNANFPLFLCSIIRGELHLLIEEQTSLSTMTFSDPQSFDALIGRSASGSIKVDNGGGGGGVPGLSRSYSESLPSDVLHKMMGVELTEEADDLRLSRDESEGPRRTNSKDRMMPKVTNETDRRLLSRVNRCSTVHRTCMGLLDSILVLLLGDPKAQSLEGDEVTEEAEDKLRVWSRLPYQMLLDVKKSLDATIKELFDFIKDCANSLTVIAAATPAPASAAGSGDSTSSATAGASITTERYVMSVTQVKDLVCRTVLTVAGYVSEDDDLVKAFVDYLPYVMRCSAIVPPTIKPTAGTGSGSAAPDKNQSVAQGMSFVNKIAVAGDVLQYVLPIILSMLQALGTEDEDKQLLDRLYNTLDSIMGAAVYMLNGLISTIGELLYHELEVAESGAAGSTKEKANNIPLVVNIRMALLAGMNLSVVALDLLQCLFEWKDADIQTLLRSEGASAFHSIVFVQADQMKKLYVTMKNGWPCIQDFLGLLNRELERAAASSDANVKHVKGSRIEDAQMSIELLCTVEQYSTSMRAVAKQLHIYSKLYEGK